MDKPPAQTPIERVNALALLANQELTVTAAVHNYDKLARELAGELLQAQREKDEALKKLDFLNSKGLSVGLMKTSDRPEPYLVYVIDSDSEFDDKQLINKLVDAQIETTQLRNAVDELVNGYEKMAKHHSPTCKHFCLDCYNISQFALTLANNLPHKKQSPSPSASDGSTKR